MGSTMAFKSLDIASGFRRLLRDERGNAAVRPALIFAAIAMAMAVLLTPQVERAADQFVENRAMGIDRVITGSTEKVRQYTIRRSVLDEPGE